MAKIHTPPEKLDLNLVSATLAAAEKATGAKKSTMLIVPRDQIKVIPDFNVRVTEAEDYKQHVATLAQSIKANGYDQTKPLAGYIAKEGDTAVIYVTDGHSRLAAVDQVNADPDLDEKDEIKTLPVVVQPSTATLEDLTVALHTSNSGRPLTPFELGLVVKRLLNAEGADKAAIAARLSVTPRYLDDVLLLVSAPAKVRSAVLEGSFSSTAAIQELRRDPKQAAERIETAVKKAKESGKSKATKKDLGPKMTTLKLSISLATGTDVKDVLKLMAAHVRDTLALTTDGDVQTLAADGSLLLVFNVPAEEKPKTEKKQTADKKPRTRKKAETPAPAPATEQADDDEGEETSAEDSVIDGETVPMPPVELSDPDVPDNDDI